MPKKPAVPLERPSTGEFDSGHLTQIKAGALGGLDDPSCLGYPHPMNFSLGSLLGGLLFSCLGLVVFRFGKARQQLRLAILGLALMVYPYFTPSTAATWLVGSGLTAALFVFRRWFNDA